MRYSVWQNVYSKTFLYVFVYYVLGIVWLSIWSIIEWVLKKRLPFQDVFC